MVDSKQFISKSHSDIMSFVPKSDGSQPAMNLALQLEGIKQPVFKSLGNVNPGSTFKKFDIDFTFNTIKDVKKVQWKDSAPWFREIQDGFCWLAYCQND